MADPVLRPTTPADDEAIAACIAEAFPGNPKADVEVLRWQYRRNPWGASPGFVWEDDGRIVGHYSAFPMPLRFRGADSLVANAVDAAIAPSHQDRRLFRPLARALYDDCATKGLPVSYCFASNRKALRGVAAVGWREVARLRPHVAAVDDRWLADRFHVPRPLATVARTAVFRLGAGPRAAEVDDVPAGVDDLWARWTGRHPHRNGVARTADWWRWRYTEAPHVTYRLLAHHHGDELTGVAAVLVRDDFGGRFACILDLLADDTDTDAARALVRAAAALDGVVGVASLAVDGSPESGLARAAGLRPLPRRLEPRAAFAGVVDNAGTLGPIETEPWSVAWGDLDHL